MTVRPFVAGLALVAALTAAGPVRAAFGDPMRGQALFVSKGCVQCHAVRGAGGRIGPDLGRASVKGSFSAIVGGMWNHAITMGDKMLEFRVTRPAFTTGELADLVAFLYLLNYFDEPGDPRIGKILFSEKHCIECHRVGLAGGSLGPRLDRLARGTAPLRIAQDLWNHGPTMTPAIRRMGLSVPEFKGNEIIDLFAYLRSQGQREAARDFRSAGDPVKGQRLFAAKGCARCHAVFGASTSADDRIGPDLGRTELRGSVTQLAGTMWNHWPVMSEAMKAMGIAPPTFRGDELADVFAYLFLSRYDGPRLDAARGLAVYRQKGCATCHGQAGEGGIGPALRTVLRGEARERIAERMWNHAPQMWDRMSQQLITWPRFEADELATLLAFLAGGFSDR